jgi:hypothetical protein
MLRMMGMLEGAREGMEGMESPEHGEPELYGTREGTMDQAGRDAGGAEREEHAGLGVP